MNIDGNEKADVEAKKAALEKLRKEQAPSHYKLKSAQITRIKDDINMIARKTWNNGKENARQYHKLTRSHRLKTGTRLYNNLTRKQSANLIRLHTDHYRLNKYLNQCNIIEESIYDCGHGIENVKHFLLLCKNYEEPRKELRKKIGGRNMRMKNLFDDPKLVKNTLEYVEKIGRFNFVWLIESRINRLKNIFQREKGVKLDWRTY